MALLKITTVAGKLGIPGKYVEPYGRYKAKISLDLLDELKDRKNAKVVLVTAITPTKSGEGKTTTSIALTEGLKYVGKKAILALREPSLGPVFGIKGGATGGGLASIAPKDEINLHFTGDMHALTTSVNLIAAIIDNHIYQGNALGIDPERIVWKRALDMNDRALREVEVAMGGKNGVPRKEHFVITVASELMAILCLADSPEDFHERIKKIIVAYDFKGNPVRLEALRVSNAIMKLMKDAFKPNLVQTLEHDPVLVHGGPFANIAHGCNSLLALKMGMKLADVLVTEAGFGADLGAEKFFDILCPASGIRPDGAVLVASVRALKLHGGAPKGDESLNVEALLKGCENLRIHLENVGKFGVPVVVAINRFPSDHPEEIKALCDWCAGNGYEAAVLEGYQKGGRGAKALAAKVVRMLEEKPSHYHKLYDHRLLIRYKIETIAKEIYRAGKVEFTDEAKEEMERYEAMGYGDLPICMAKTPLSLSDDPKALGAPVGSTITIREIDLSAGAGFLVPLTGKILTMPGLPKVPSAVKMEDE